MTWRLLASAGLVVSIGCAQARFSRMSEPPDQATLARASLNGKYADLLATFEIPDDVERYGDFHDYGFWPGRRYKGVHNLPTGYWVYLAPTWFIWKRLVPPASAPAPIAVDGQPNAQAACSADETHCCLPDGRLVIPGGCSPSYPPGVQPAARRAEDGRCLQIPCFLK